MRAIIVLTLFLTGCVTVNRNASIDALGDAFETGCELGRSPAVMSCSPDAYKQFLRENLRH